MLESKVKECDKKIVEIGAKEKKLQTELERIMKEKNLEGEPHTVLISRLNEENYSLRK